MCVFQSVRFRFALGINDHKAAGGDFVEVFLPFGSSCNGVSEHSGPVPPILQLMSRCPNGVRTDEDTARTKSTRALGICTTITYSELTHNAANTATA